MKHVQPPNYEKNFQDVKLDVDDNITEPEPYDKYWWLPRDSFDGSGGAIKTWSQGDTLTASDLNANFQHIHGSMVGGHGARLINADVAASAAIASSKLAAYRLIPRAFGRIVTGCTATCTIGEVVNVTSAAVSGNVMTVTLNYTASDADYTVILSEVNASPSGFCKVGGKAPTNFTVYCSEHIDTSSCVTSAGASCDYGLMTAYPEVNFVVFDTN